MLTRSYCTGLVQQCAVFESPSAPKDIKDLKRVEVREGARTTGIGKEDDTMEECADTKNPQDGEHEKLEDPLQ